MRRVFIAMLTAVMVFGAISTIGAKPKNTTDGNETVVFKTNITCDNCKQRIEESIPFEKGVKSVYVNVPEKLVAVEFDSSKTSEEKIRKAIEKLGYTAEKADADLLAADRSKECCRKEHDGKRDSLPAGDGEGMPEHRSKGGPAQHRGFERGGEGRPAHAPHHRPGHSGGIEHQEPPKGELPPMESVDRPAPPAGERPEPPKDVQSAKKCSECVTTVSSDSDVSDAEEFVATVSND